MSNFIVPNYDFASEISDSFDQGYSDSSAVHRTVGVVGTDANGLAHGYSVGYLAARDFHKAAILSGTDLSGQSRGYLDGYDAASLYHTTNTVSGNDGVGRERGYYEGYKAARDYHVSVSYSGNDSTGSQRGYYKGYLAARDYHTTNSTSGNDPTGVQRGYAEGYGIGYSAGNSAGLTTGNTAGITTGRNQVGRWMLRTPSNQTLSTSVYTKVNFNTASSTVKGVTHNTGSDRITITQAGVYEVAAGWEITRNSSSSYAKLARASIKKNNVFFRHGDTSFYSNDSPYGMVTVRERFSCAVGDYIEIFAYADFNGNKYIEQVSADSTDAFFIGIREI